MARPHDATPLDGRFFRSSSTKAKDASKPTGNEDDKPAEEGPAPGR